MIRESIGLLGLRVKDKITGLVGVIVAISFDLPGCIQAYVSTPIGKDGKLHSHWFDVNRMETQSPMVPIMPLPTFSDKQIDDLIDMLGFRIIDKITGMTGVVATAMFEIDGSMNVIIDPGVNAEGKLDGRYAFNIVRLEVMDEPRRVKAIDFDRTAAAIPPEAEEAKPEVATRPAEYAHGSMDKSNVIG